MPAWDKNEARKMISSGCTYSDVGKHFEVTASTVHRRLDETYAQKRRDQINARRQYQSGLYQRAGLSVDPTNRDDVAARLAEIPPDTRDLTGQLCGDPIPDDPRRHWLRAPSVQSDRSTR